MPPRETKRLNQSGSAHNGARPSPGAATPGRVERPELSHHHPAADVAVPETGTLRSAGP
jgi:hypothetical protein